MPKHPLWFLGFPSQPAYRGATHEVVYRKGETTAEELADIRARLVTSLNERYRAKHDLLQEHLRSGSELSDPRVLYDVLFGVGPAVEEDAAGGVNDPSLPQAEEVLVDSDGDDNSPLEAKGDGVGERGPPPTVPVVLSEVDEDSVYVHSFQLLWEKDHGRRIRFIQKYGDGTDKVVHIDAFKDVVRFRPNKHETKQQFWKRKGAFFEGYGQQFMRGCYDCFDLYPPNFMADLISRELNPKRVEEVKGRIRDFLKTKLSNSKNVFGERKTTDLKGEWKSYTSLEISDTKDVAKKCTIFVTGSSQNYIVHIGETRKLMGSVTIFGTDADFNERVMTMFEPVCERMSDNTLIPNHSRLSAWKTIYDFSRGLNVKTDVLELTNLLDDVAPPPPPVYRGTGTEDVLYSRFDAMMTPTPTDSPTDSLYARFGDMSKQFDSLHHTTPPPRTYHGGIGPLGNVFAEM